MIQLIFTIANIGMSFVVYRIATLNIPLALGLVTFFLLTNTDTI